MTDDIDIQVGDVVMHFGPMEPPRFHQVTTFYERRQWAIDRRHEIKGVLRFVWKPGQPTTPAAEPPQAPACGREFTGGETGRMLRCYLPSGHEGCCFGKPVPPQAPALPPLHMRDDLGYPSQAPAQLDGTWPADYIVAEMKREALR